MQRKHGLKSINLRTPKGAEAANPEGKVRGFDARAASKDGGPNENRTHIGG
jgi:hypothetical protein